jgi:hypothetical protein
VSDSLSLVVQARRFWGLGSVRLVCFLGIVFLGLGIRFHNLTEVLVEGRFYFVDADCYSRMSRVREVAQHPGTVVRMHWFENWPQGVVSHATSPLDYAVYLLSVPVGWMTPETGRWSVLLGQSLDVAGALIGPLLGGVLVGVLALGFGFWEKEGLETGRVTAVCLSVVSPALVHATTFGRPDHQALLVVLLALGLLSERRMARGGGHGWAWMGGGALGTALWVSWWEPAVFLLLILGCSAAGWPRTWTPGLRGRWGAALLGCVVLGITVDGAHVALPSPDTWDILGRWGGTIGELQALESFFGLLRWSGALLLGVPVAVVFALRQSRARELLSWSTMLAVMTALTVWQIRWSPYFVLVCVFVFPEALGFVRKSWMRMSLALFSFWPIASEWDDRWFATVGQSVERDLDRSERINLRLAAERLRSHELLPFVAPWWHAPALAYWSGQPAVGGSSHEGIAGIRDSARIYLGTDPEEVRALLGEKKACVIVAGDRARIVENCSQLLGQVPPVKPLADLLWSAEIPLAWGLLGESNVTTFRLVRVLP